MCQITYSNRMIGMILNSTSGNDNLGLTFHISSIKNFSVQSPGSYKDNPGLKSVKNGVKTHQYQKVFVNNCCIRNSSNLLQFILSTILIFKQHNPECFMSFQLQPILKHLRTSMQKYLEAFVDSQYRRIISFFLMNSRDKK